MKRIVIDTSSFIRAFLESDTVARDMFKMFPSLDYQLVMTEEIAKEWLIATNNVILRRKMNPNPYLRAVAVFLLKSIEIEKKTDFSWCSDPDDAMFIECAIDAQAKYVISNDRSLTGLKEYVTDERALEMIRDIEFVTPGDFLKIHTS
ncbi:hypothetical protein CULT_1800003 [[Clostridium] ultunense Esp]|nr:hypothetical protein CULT_1800003 [[Clostridium] ultunense Esp]